MTSLPTPRLAAEASFSCLRDFLLESGYTQPAVQDRLGIRRMSESLKMYSNAPAGDRLEALIQLLLLGETVATHWLTPAALAALCELGLARIDGEQVTASVELYPAAGLYCVSDRNRGEELPPGEDKVFSAITPNTEEFMDMLPETPCPSFLEICAGAGLAAMHAASRYAVQSFAYDLAARSTLFAEFNRRLNAIPNMTAARGDLYQPAGPRTFDRIAAHPPYVPTLRATELLRDGGVVGEDLTRRIVEGLPLHLYPGGRLYCLALLNEIAGQRVADRVRSWLHHSESEYDVLVAARGRVEPARLVFDNWRVREAAPGDVTRWQSIFKQRRVEAFVYSTIIIERHAEQRPASTIAVECGGAYDPSAVEALLVRAPLWESRPRAAQAIAQSVRTRLSGGAWSDETRSYSIETPFRFTCDAPQWMGRVLAACDGTRTVRELQPTGVDDSEYAGAIETMLRGGMLRI